MQKFLEFITLFGEFGFLTFKAITGVFVLRFSSRQLVLEFCYVLFESLYAFGEAFVFFMDVEASEFGLWREISMNFALEIPSLFAFASSAIRKFLSMSLETLSFAMWLLPSLINNAF